MISACGNNQYGQLGDGSNTDQLLVMVQLDSVAQLLGVGPSAESVFFVTDDGEAVYGTGLNDRGQLGVGDSDNRNVPTLVTFGQEVVTDVLSASGDHTLLLGRVTGTLPPTVAPTIASTPAITLSPTTQAPITQAPVTQAPTTLAPTIPKTLSPTTTPREAQDLFLWGNPKTVGQDIPDDVIQPLFVEEDAVDVSAGSHYSIIVLADGSALSAGLIESLDDYKGHLGIEEGDVVERVNEFQPISQVYDSDSLSYTSPKFDRAFAGVENSPDSLTQDAGIIHSILLDKQGHVYATGSNSKGQLCLGDSNNRMVPEKIPLDGKVIDVAIGGEHTLLLLEDGTLYGCGSNAEGQLGLDVVQDVSTPTLIEGYGGVLSISAGHSHSLFTAEDGIYYAGNNEYGQLCIDTSGDNIKIFTKLDISEAVSSFEAIKESSYILHEDGSVRSCGRNNFGQLGDGTNTDQILSEVQLADNVARLLGVGPSSESVFFVTTEEMVWGTGLNDRGQLGVGDIENRNLPTMVNFGSQVLLVEISAGHGHTLALGSVTGSLATTAPSASPTVFVESTSPTISPTLPLAVIETTSPTAAVSESSNIPTVLNGTMSPTVVNGTMSPTVMNGTMSPSVMLNGTLSPSVMLNGTLSPTVILNGTIGPTSPATTAWPTMNPTAFEGGSRLPTVLNGTYAPTSNSTSNGTETGTNGTDIPEGGGTEMYYWGSSGSIGEASDEILSPLSSGTQVVDLSAGPEYSLTVLADGSAQSAGFVESLDTYHGHLGIPQDQVTGLNAFQPITSVFDAETDSIIDAPSFLLSFTGADTAETPGEIHSLLISEDGEAWAFGSNSKGELCLGDNEDRFLPQRIPIDGTVIGAALGSEHTLLLLDDGTMYGCGSNSRGQIGLNDIQDVSTPTLIEGLSDVTSMSAGLDFSLVKSDLGLYVMGSNEFGNLCIDNGAVDVTAPELISDVDVTIVSTFEAIQSSSYISFLDGSVGACGKNDVGQLGDGTNEDRVRTVIDPLPDDSPIRKLGVGPSSNSIFMVNDNGDTYATGLNDRGQLGVGDTDNRNTLTQVVIDTPAQISAASTHTLARLEE